MSVPAKLILNQDNTQLVRLFGVQDQTTGAFWGAGATVTGTLYDQGGTPVAGAQGIVFAYQAASLGNFFGPVGPAFAPPTGGGYLLIVDGDFGGSHLHMEIPTEIQPRSK